MSLQADKSALNHGRFGDNIIAWKTRVKEGNPFRDNSCHLCIAVRYYQKLTAVSCLVPEQRKNLSLTTLQLKIWNLMGDSRGDHIYGFTFFHVLNFDPAKECNDSSVFQTISFFLRSGRVKSTSNNNQCLRRLSTLQT